MTADTFATNRAQQRADEIKAEREHSAARQLVALYAERVRLASVMAQEPTGANADAVLSAGRELDEACETFRRRFYPRRARCVVGLYSVMVASPTSRSVETVLDLFDEYPVTDEVE